MRSRGRGCLPRWSVKMQNSMSRDKWIELAKGQAELVNSDTAWLRVEFLARAMGVERMEAAE
jgi:hypothetical protein